MTKQLALIAAFAASFSLAAFAADDDAKIARKQANDTYKADKKACEAMKGKEEKDCMKQAKAKHSQAMSQVKKMKKEHKASTGASTAPSSSDAAPATSGSSVK